MMAQVGVLTHVVVQVDMSGQVNEPWHVVLPGQVTWEGQVAITQVTPHVVVPSQVIEPPHVGQPVHVTVPGQVGNPCIVGSESASAGLATAAGLGIFTPAFEAPLASNFAIDVSRLCWKSGEGCGSDKPRTSPKGTTARKNRIASAEHRIQKRLCARVVFRPPPMPLSMTHLLHRWFQKHSITRSGFNRLRMRPGRIPQYRF
jgi:hypothetical protein